jgi:uncharacterized membrane protein YgdD (TMEM256/DUF423 family)
MGAWLVLAGLNGAIGVAAGAYGWHALGGNDIFALGVLYQLVHVPALLAVSWLASVLSGRAALVVRVAGSAFALGIVLFSGSLYALVLVGGVPVAGAAPVGGFLLMLGWLALAATAFVRSDR